ncbi:MAG: TIGR03862 family flavoprotein [Pseudomonadota bacterium]
MPILKRVAIIGAGPAGLMAAEVLSTAGMQIDIYDAMPSVGRKFLLAGRGGLNLTHTEPAAQFLSRFGNRSQTIAPWLTEFDAQALRDWVHALGHDTFVGTSGRVFPTDKKAAPLLRAWLHRLREAGVTFHVRHRWLGWAENNALRFATPDGERQIDADAVVLALGGGSWAKLGSDGAWVPMLQAQGVQVAALQPANCGFDVGWSEHLRTRFAGQPIKSVTLSFIDASGSAFRRQGELILTATGVEGGLIYAASARLRDTITETGSATFHLDLAPGWESARLTREIAHPRGSRSFSSHLQSRIHIHGVKMALLREIGSTEDFADPERLATLIKALPIRLVAPRPIDEAISSAGGVMFDALDAHLMLGVRPGVFCAGEMIDWEAPTGGYLLTACLASGRVAGLGVRDWLSI